MNKTLIALAITAALPVAAQADLTLSGSVSTSFNDAGVVDTDTSLSTTASQVLANGMTATASFDVLGGENQGSATLSGDFGTLTAGEIGSDGAFQSGDVGGAVGGTEDADEGSIDVSGIHLSTSQAGLDLAIQINGGTGADASTAASRSTQVGASMDFNGVTVGYAYASDEASAAAAAGVTDAVTAFGVAYTMGDIAITAGKASNASDAVYKLAYNTSLDALTVAASIDQDSAYAITLGYALNDALSLSATLETDTNTVMSVSYAAGDVTASVTNGDDNTTDASIALDLGNADLELARDGGDSETSVSYTVAF